MCLTMMLSLLWPGPSTELTWPLVQTQATRRFGTLSTVDLSATFTDTWDVSAPLLGISPLLARVAEIATSFRETFELLASISLK